MNEKLKNELDKKFDKDKNYNAIMQKVRKENKIKFVIVPTFVLVFVLIVIFSINLRQYKIVISNDIENQKIGEIFNLNLLDNNSISFYSLNNIDKTSKQDLDYNKKFYVPDGFKLKEYYNINTYDNLATGSLESDDKVNEYNEVYSFENGDRNIKITYSQKGMLLTDYNINSKKNEATIINNNEVYVYKYNDIYIATFEFDDKDYSIYANKIDEKELLNILLSIIK